MIQFAVPGEIDQPTGGYAYARRILAEWQTQGIDAAILPLPGSFPYPGERDLKLCRDVFSITEGALLIDGLAFGAFPEDLAALVGARTVALVHHPLCDEQGLDEETRTQLEKSERRALSMAARVVATSPNTGRDLIERFDVLEERLTVAIPGTDAAVQAAISYGEPRLLSVGAVTPRKGYGDLINAVATCADLEWRCDIVGALDRDTEEVDRLDGLIRSLGMQDRVTLCGPVDDISDYYISADLFVTASLHEGYGMAVTEALAHGLPVVTTTAGALAETAPCARHVPAGDPAALAMALRPLIADRANRLDLARECRAFAKELPDWAKTARIVAQAVDAVR